MARSLGNMVIHLGLDSRGMQSGAAKAEASISALQSQFALFATGIATGIAGFVGWGAKLASEAQTAQVSFEVMLGSAEEATKVLGDLRDFSARTPFQFTDLQAASQTLLAFGIEGEKLLPTLQMLGDISGGSSEKLKQIALAYGQIASAGKLAGQDLLQLINAGFNPLQEIARKTGISIAELKKQMSAGKITFEMVEEAFRSATSEGGRFFGMMEKQSQTLAGKWSTLKDNVSLLAMAIGNELLPVLGRGVDVIADLVKWLNGLDAGFIQNTLRIGAMAAAFVSMMVLVPKIISLIALLVRAFRALATAQAIQQAFSGAKGWAVLATSLAVAASTGYAVNKMFEEQEAKIAVAAESAAAAAEATDEVASAFDALTSSQEDNVKEWEKLEKFAERVREQLRTPEEVFVDTMVEMNNLLDKGLLTIEQYNRALKKTEETLANASNNAKDLGSIRANVGAADRFTSQGFSASQSTRLQEITKRDAEERRKQHDKTNELLAEANRISKEAKEKSGVTLKKVTL